VGNTTTVATRKAMVAMVAGILGVENLNQGTESELPYKNLIPLYEQSFRPKNLILWYGMMVVCLDSQHKET
jgi:hypothetical protein